MKTTVMFFGALSEITGRTALEVEGFSDTDAVQMEILRQYPQLKGRKYALALNQQLLRAAAPLTEGSTLAFYPHFQEDRPKAL